MEKVKLKDICEVVSGTTPKTSIEEYWDGDIDWITPAELKEDSYIIDESVRKITELAVKKSALKSFPEGTVILSSRAPIGKVAIAGKEMYCNQGFKNLICSDRVSSFYLYWFFKGKTEYLNSLGRGATFKEISKGIVENIEIPLPNLEVQAQISERLKKCNDIIRLRKEQIEKLDDLIKSQFIELFGDTLSNQKQWPVYLLSEISTSRLGKMLDAKQQTGKYKFPYLANFNVQWFKFDLSNLNEMDFNEKDQQEFELKNGDLLVTEGGEVGRCAVWNSQIENCYFQKALHRVRCNESIILPEYLAHVFKFRADYNQFQDIVGSKSTIAHLTGEKLKKIEIPVPPIIIQNKFTEFVRQVEKQKFLVQKSLNETQLLFDCLMQKYFA